jgi:hypothetical protein
VIVSLLLGLSHTFEYASASCSGRIVVHCGNENDRRWCDRRHDQWPRTTSGTDRHFVLKHWSPGKIIAEKRAHLRILFSFQNGVLLRSVLDSVTGDMSDTRTRYIGSKPVKLFRIMMQGNEAVSLEGKHRMALFVLF